MAALNFLFRWSTTLHAHVICSTYGVKNLLFPCHLTLIHIWYVDTRVQNDKSEHQGQHPLSTWSLVYCVEEKLQKPEYYLHHCDQIYEVRFTDLWKVRLQTRVFESVHWHQVLFQFLSWAADRNEKPKLNVETIVCGRCRRNTNFDANIKRLYIYIYMRFKATTNTILRLSICQRLPICGLSIQRP